MRYAKTLVPFVLFASGLLTQPALADPIEIKELNDHCGAVTVTNHVVAGGCETKGTGDPTKFKLTRHVFGIESTIAQGCDSHMELNLDEDGNGYISKVEFAGAGVCATLAAETEAGGAMKPWLVLVTENATTGVLETTVDFDFKVGMSPVNGVATLDLGPDVCCLKGFNARIVGSSGPYEWDNGAPAGIYWELKRDNGQSTGGHMSVTHL